MRSNSRSTRRILASDARAKIWDTVFSSFNIIMIMEVTFALLRRKPAVTSRCAQAHEKSMRFAALQYRHVISAHRVGDTRSFADGPPGFAFALRWLSAFFRMARLGSPVWVPHWAVSGEQIWIHAIDHGAGWTQGSRIDRGFCRNELITVDFHPT